jgi:peptide deformylase
VDSDIQLIHFPHPTLRFKSKPVVRVDAQLAAVVARMFDVMYENNGVGLAANQVNIPLRIFVANPAGRRDEGQEFAFINPVISRQRGTEEANEGCLSLPGINAPVKRSKALHLSAYDMQGREIEFDCDGFMARIIQHETDHLDGVMFIDRLSEVDQRSFENEVATLVYDFESKQRIGGLASTEELEASTQDWLTRYA